MKKMIESVKQHKKIAISIIFIVILMLLSVLTVWFMPMISDVKVINKDCSIYYNSEDSEENVVPLELEYTYKYDIPEFLKQFKIRQLALAITSDNEKVAIVDGMSIRGIAGGKAKINIRNADSNIDESFSITVYGKLKSIHTEDLTLSVLEPEKVPSYTLDPKDAEPQEYTVTVKDEAIAKVEDGKIKMVKAGETTYQVASSDGKISSEGKLKVLSSPTSLSVKNMELAPGETANIAVTTDVEDPDIGTAYIYTSDNKDVAKVDENGLVTAISDGTATITVKNETGLSAKCKVTVSIFPIKYSDSTANITITKEWFENAWCYVAHLKFSDYARFGTYCANDTYGSVSTVSAAYGQLSSILTINGCYSASYLGYPVARGGIVRNDKACWVPAVYSRWSGKLMSAWETNGTPGIVGVQLSTLVKNKQVSDTFCFGPPFLVNGTITCGDGGGRAQRTFIGTNGNPGDIYLVVSDGRYNDGESAGLTGVQCARLLKSKGCTFGVPLDGGGSSEMIFQGKILNAVSTERDYLVDFVYFK